MTRRQAGFSFIEILVVMGIISILAAALVVGVPFVQEQARRTNSVSNLQKLVQYGVTNNIGDKWPKLNGKHFTLWLVASNRIDRRDDQQLRLLFSPGDGTYKFEDVTGKGYEGINLEALRGENQEFLKLTSYAGRRNKDREHQLSPNEQSRGAILYCDDDDGPLHHKDGIATGTLNGAKFVEWADLGMAPPDPEKPEGTLGDNSPNEQLKHMSSGN